MLSSSSWDLISGLVFRSDSGNFSMQPSSFSWRDLLDLPWYARFSFICSFVSLVLQCSLDGGLHNSAVAKWLTALGRFISFASSGGGCRVSSLSSSCACLQPLVPSILIGEGILKVSSSVTLGTVRTLLLWHVPALWSICWWIDQNDLFLY